MKTRKALERDVEMLKKIVLQQSEAYNLLLAKVMDALGRTQGVLHSHIIAYEEFRGATWTPEQKHQLAELLGFEMPDVDEQLDLTVQ